MTGELPSGTEISNGIKEQDPKSVFEVNTSGNSQNISPSWSMAEGVHPGSCRSNAISRRCGLPQVWRQSGPYAQERRSLVLVQSFQ